MTLIDIAGMLIATLVAVPWVAFNLSLADAPSPLEQLRTLEVRPLGPHDGYSRSKFGGRWADVDGNGCDTRNDVLRRDLSSVSINVDSCTVQSGVLEDPYTGRTVAFRRGPGTSDDVQIDHVVALSAAWETGAAAWPTSKRTAFANDPRNLVATSGRTNASKGDRDASEWLPPDPRAHCSYAELVVEVKATYALWVTPAEAMVLDSILRACP